jgi:gamma-glutamyltranspeptidase / glutathione hydrolase
MQMDLEHLVFPGMHQPVFATNGVVATSQPLAAQAGLAVLRRGGNAVDAAIATAATLTVVEPASTGIGGDAFAMVWDGTRIHGLNGSGRAPTALTAEVVRERGYQEVPDYGWLSVTVPGAPAAWRDLHDRFGKLPFATLFEPAMEYAEHGYPVSPISRWSWKWAAERVHARLSGEEFVEWAGTFTPEGRVPRVGETWRSPEMARSLRLIAETNAEAFYTGEIAFAIVSFAARTGGFISAEDLAHHTGNWVEPIHAEYRDYDVWEMPPNSQGLAALIALNILEDFDLSRHPRQSVESFHLQIEAMKLAFADAQQYIGDPDHATVPTQELISKRHAARRAGLIGERALDVEPGDPWQGDTTYLCTADRDGMMVSFIQSTSSSFGSHVVVPGTGITLQNRGSGFTLEHGHPNRLEPGKRSFHTIIPGFLTRDGEPIGPFGVMGGHMQPQGHVQMVVNTVDYGMDPQASLDAPRWSWWEGRHVKLEPGVPAPIVEGLKERGHEVEVDAEVDTFGRGQIIWRLPSKVYVAGSDGRTDGCAAGY